MMPYECATVTICKINLDGCIHQHFVYNKNRIEEVLFAPLIKPHIGLRDRAKQGETSMNIFISYRRVEDKASNIVYILHAKLSDAFGEENVFRDTRDITAGTEWRAELAREVNTCKVMLVIIGPDWASLTGANGEKRLFNENDVTRWEVETGLQRRKKENIALIPVLVQGAKLPGKAELPPTLQELSEIQTLTIRNDLDLDRDIERLIEDIRTLQGFREEDIKIQEEFEPKTVFIAEGSFLMGSPEGSEIPTYESPQHEVLLPAYRIGKYPVTNAQYEVFIRETNRPVPLIMGWDGPKVPPGLERHPVTGMKWLEALAYCQWLSEITKRKYTLPSEAQWEKACRGGNNFQYPWGNELDPNRSNHGCATLAAVDAYPAQNDYGLYDMVGNIKQWTCTLWGEKRIQPEARFSYPWKDDSRNDVNANDQIRRVMRGCSMRDPVFRLRCSSRSGHVPEDAGFPGTRHGFRVVVKI
jgi:formylglycine-generating enzyme required for sulfatase activity